MVGRLLIPGLVVVASAAGLAQTPAPPRGAAPAAPRPPARIAVGAVCEDGLLLPIAVRNQNSWRALTDDRDGPPLKLTVEAKALPRTGWTFLPFDPDIASEPLTPEGTARLDDASPCADQEGFRSNAPKGARARRPTEFIGLALMGGLTVGRVETVQHMPDPASRRVGTLAMQLTQALETERAEAAARSPLLPSAEDRARVDVLLWNMWRYRYAERDWYYFETQKDYESETTGNTFVKGWVVATPSGASASLMNVQVSVGNASDGVTAQAIALGVLRVGASAAWLFHEQGYEGGRFELVEMAAAPRQPVCLLRAC
jgi:hypothetical protein